MPVVIPIGTGLAQFRFIVAGASREAVVTMGYDPALIEPADNAEALSNLFTAPGRPGQASSMVVGWSYLGVRVTEMDASGPFTGEFSNLVVGSGTGNPMPPNVAVLMRKNTAAGGRRGRGRSYIPPLYPGEENVGPNGSIAAAQLTNLQTWWSSLFTAMQGAALPPVIFHSISPFTATPVTSFTVQQTVATQRRRLRRQ